VEGQKGNFLGTQNLWKRIYRVTCGERERERERETKHSDMKNNAYIGLLVTVITASNCETPTNLLSKNLIGN
jgi:hypothetical protein